MKTNDGGAAFPMGIPDVHDGSGGGSQGFAQPGMTLRDYFAGQALIGFASKHNHGDGELYAADSYRVADAMLEQRDKETS